VAGRAITPTTALVALSGPSETESSHLSAIKHYFQEQTLKNSSIDMTGFLEPVAGLW
jgi:hypothetical protein